MRTNHDVGNLEVIDREDCLRLLATQAVGRIGFVQHGSAEVLPVNYVLDGDAVVFATAGGAKLASSEGSSVVFEVDMFDGDARTGWSVVVHGLAHEVTALDAPDLVARIGALTLAPWAGGERSRLVRIAPRTITGRRIGPIPT